MSAKRRAADHPEVEIQDLSASHECFGLKPLVFCPECCAHAHIQDEECLDCDLKVKPGEVP